MKNVVHMLDEVLQVGDIHKDDCCRNMRYVKDDDDFLLNLGLRFNVFNDEEDVDGANVAT